MGITIFILILLVSFNRTINRLTKPVSYLLIFSLLISAMISFLYFFNKIDAVFPLSNYFEIFEKTNLVIHLNALTEKLIIIFSIVISIIIGISIYKLPRKKGYVLFIIGVGLFSSSVIFSILFLDVENLILT